MVAHALIPFYLALGGVIVAFFLMRGKDMKDPDDIIYWPCGFWCYRSELSEMTHKSDDYIIYPVGCDDWLAIASSENFVEE